MLLLRLAVTSAWITASLSIYVVLFLLVRHGNCFCRDIVDRRRQRRKSLLRRLMDDEDEEDSSEDDLESDLEGRPRDQEAYANSSAVVGVIV